MKMKQLIELLNQEHQSKSSQDNFMKELEGDEVTEIWVTSVSESGKKCVADFKLFKDCYLGTFDIKWGGFISRTDGSADVTFSPDYQKYPEAIPGSIGHAMEIAVYWANRWFNEGIDQMIDIDPESAMPVLTWKDYNR